MVAYRIVGNGRQGENIWRVVSNEQREGILQGGAKQFQYIAPIVHNVEYFRRTQSGFK